MSTDRNMKPKVYLAGKITKNGWRNQVINLRRALNPPLYTDLRSVEWPTIIGDEFDYVGPYFISCDHGCFHGENGHAYGTTSSCGDCSFLADQFYHHSSSRTDYRDKRFLTELCKSAIKKADIIFAWIDSVDCYGTIVELGYAHGLGEKLIWIATPSKMSDIGDLWFLYAMTDNISHRSPGVLGSFNTALCTWKHQNIENLLESPIEKKFWQEIHSNGFPYTLTPQHHIGRYRVDFAIVDHKVVIELDGHDYHKTKEQRTNDAQRERWLKLNGWDVVRFTGSEIWRDVSACVAQLGKYMEQKQ